MESLLQALLEAYLSAKDPVKEFFVVNHLEFFWDGIRETIFSPWLIVVGLLPALLIERFSRNATPYRFPSVNLAYDLFYNAMNGIVLAGFLVYCTELIWSFYESAFPFLNLQLLDNKALWLQVVGAFLIRDFTFFASHWARHKIPWLWYFHSIHHDQKVLNPATTLRAHPLDIMNGLFLSAIPIMIVGGTYHAFIAFNVLIYSWRFFIHSNIKLQFGPLNYLIVSPQFHRVHHSLEKEHIDHNYGEWLSIWDFIFGTAVKDFDVYPECGVKGVPELEEKNYRFDHFSGLWIKHTLYPFKKIGESIYGAVAGLFVTERTS